MSKLKKSVSIHISDLDDLNGVLTSLEKLIQTIIYHYIDKGDDLRSLTNFVLSVASYFGQILKWLGYDEDSFGEKE
jgi:hypothetical protein